MIVGYAAGAFDLFHVGHLNILRQAKSRCDFLIAGVVCDERVELAKGYRPVIPTQERAEIVANISYVDKVFIETSENRLDTWAEVEFDVFFKGDDWKGTTKGRELERLFSTVGVRVEYFPYTMHTSSTKLRTVLDTLSGALPGAVQA
ncbi:adenylyltransferase/cytidyltransferase family protein [Glutamicibacter sp. AOP12-B1-11]|uniref:adenylyltransferase/cytidyltransferase family protein n=1 Tax=Glutamicibacter sp. AOP12-B1-11 TaxID=3457725 RepID=UPI004033F39A